MAKIPHAPSGGMGSTMKMKVNRAKTEHGIGTALPFAKFREGGMAESKKMVQREVDFFKKKGAPKDMIKHEEREAKGMKAGGTVKLGMTGQASGGGTARGWGAATKGRKFSGVF